MGLGTLHNEKLHNLCLRIILLQLQNLGVELCGAHGTL
jgi:hypothetical protein